MARPLADIARELGVPAETIAARCVAEGVPREMVEGPDVRVTTGLEASVYEWFAAGEDGSGLAQSR